MLQNRPDVKLRRASTWIGFTVLALMPMVPDSSAGYAVSAIGVLVLFVSQLFSNRAIRLDGSDFGLAAVSAMLMGFELVTVLMTNEPRDFVFALGRLYWIALLLAVMAFANAELQRGNRTVIFNALWVGLVILLAAMLAESLFWPKLAAGRDYGVIRMPLPRATGVLNGDGKIGTFLEICLSVALYYGRSLPRWKRVVLLVGPFVGLFFTQSRSGLVATATILASYWLYRCLTDRNALLRSLRWIIVLCGILLVLSYFHVLVGELINQGRYATNALDRLKLNSYALSKIAEAPLLGGGLAATREYVNGLTVHNTVLAMALKSGLFAAVLLGVTIIYPALAFRGNIRFTFFKWTLVSGLVIEHALYPGFINEFLILSYLVGKWVWCLFVQPSLLRPPRFPTDASSGAIAYG